MFRCAAMKSKLNARAIANFDFSIIIHHLNARAPSDAHTLANLDIATSGQHHRTHKP
jgi:hypothetical protein